MKCFFRTNIFCLCLIILMSPFTVLAEKDPAYWKCTKCHTGDGRSWVDEVPTITGQNKDYLRNQLENFRSGAREDNLLHVMPTIAKGLTREEIEEVISHYSKIDPKDVYHAPLEPLKPEEKELYMLGEKHAPLCLACHGDAEVRPAKRSDWPYISGQNRSALWMQLNFFRHGMRKVPQMSFMKYPPFNDVKMLDALSLYFSRQKSPPPNTVE